MKISITKTVMLFYIPKIKYDIIQMEVLMKLIIKNNIKRH